TLNSASGDTTITINISDTTNYFKFNWPDNITGIVVDPEDHIVNKTGAVQYDPNLLSVYAATLPTPAIYPNPAVDGWNIDGLLPGTMLKLYDISGKTIWAGEYAAKTFVPAQGLHKGCYLLEARWPGAQSGYYKLVK
ncbi:MAG: T9SS type A sorting domain-containing protein, partial [Taibaiella sp.]|nr:T9SS type A sorting domain-containing protein [Taibaiella sp.]